MMDVIALQKQLRGRRNDVKAEQLSQISPTTS